MSTKKQIYLQADKLADEVAERLKNKRQSIPWGFILRFNLKLRKLYRCFLHELEKRKNVEEKINFSRLKTAHYERRLEDVRDELYKWESRYTLSIETRPEIEKNISSLAAESYTLEAYIHFYEFAIAYYQQAADYGAES